MQQLSLFANVQVEPTSDAVVLEYIRGKGVSGATAREVAEALHIEDAIAVETLVRLHHARQLSPAFKANREMSTRDGRIIYVPAPGAVVDVQA